MNVVRHATKKTQVSIEGSVFHVCHKPELHHGRRIYTYPAGSSQAGFSYCRDCWKEHSKKYKRSVTIRESNGLGVLQCTAAGSFDTVLMCLWPNPEEDTLVALLKEALRVAKHNVIFETVSHKEMSLLRYHTRKLPQNLIIWHKPQGCNPLSAKRRPLDAFEEILVIRKRGSFYRPFFTYSRWKNKAVTTDANIVMCGRDTGTKFKREENLDGKRYPQNVWVGPPDTSTRLTYKIPDNPQPVWLLEQLEYCYVPPGGRVLEIGAGSGTGAIAAKRLGLHYEGIDNDPVMVSTAMTRLDAAPGTLARHKQAQYLSRQAMRHRAQMRNIYARDQEVK